MDLSQKISNKNGNAFLTLLFCLIIIAAAGYVLYTNKDFQRAHQRDISKINFYLRDYKKSLKDFTKDFGGKIAEWKKSLPLKTKDPKAEKPLESLTFDETILDPATLEKELPGEMIRHQTDEITICSFDADLILNDPLSDKEIIHLANILRFCELSTITKLPNEIFLKRISTALKVLRYNAVYETVPAETGKTLTAYLYRDDKIQPLQKSSLFKGADPLPIAPSYGLFKAGDFDFIVATFAAPASGLSLGSIVPLENFSEAVKTQYLETQDMMIFGEFAFESRGLIWDSASLLPTIAKTLPANRAPLDLLGNFWFRKKELTEFNGKSGVLDIDAAAFPSKSKPPVTANKPIWVQFRILPDDD